MTVVYETPTGGFRLYRGKVCVDHELERLGIADTRHVEWELEATYQDRALALAAATRIEEDGALARVVKERV